MKFSKHKDTSRALEKLLRDTKKRKYLIRLVKAQDKDHKLTDEDIEAIIDSVLKGVPTE